MAQGCDMLLVGMLESVHCFSRNSGDLKEMGCAAKKIVKLMIIEHVCVAIILLDVN